MFMNLTNIIYYVYYSLVIFIYSVICILIIDICLKFNQQSKVEIKVLKIEIKAKSGQIINLKIFKYVFLYIFFKRTLHPHLLYQMYLQHCKNCFAMDRTTKVVVIVKTQNVYVQYSSKYYP